MCLIRKRVKKILRQHNTSYSFAALRNAEVLAVTETPLNTNLSPFQKTGHFLWVQHNLLMQPLLFMTQNEPQEHSEQANPIQGQKSQVHSLEIMSEYDILELKTIVSEEGSTFENTSIRSDMLSICNSMISAIEEL